MGTSIAISSAALASSAAAQHAANEAKRIACESFVNTYNASTATIQDAKQYSSCINLLHPDPMTQGQLIGLKVVLGVLVIAYLVGFVVTLIKEENLLDAVFISFLWAFGAGVAMAVIAVVIFIFS